MNNILNQIANSNIGIILSRILSTDFFNAIFSMLIGFIIWLIYKYSNEQSKVKKLMSITKEKIVNKDKVKSKKISVETKYFKSLNDAVKKYYLYKPDKNKIEFVYIGILSLEVLIFAFCMIVKIPIFAFVFPVVVHIFSQTILNFLALTMDNIVQRDLSQTIKHMIKIMSKVSDLKTVIFEVSRTMKDPLRTKFFNLSRKLLTENYEITLMSFADEIDNVWIYAFVFLLLSYKEQSKKEDILSNLRRLAEIIDNENEAIEKSLTEKKPIAMLNSMLLGAGILAGIGNIAFNKFATVFFFKTIPGMICFIAGIVSIIATITINLLLVKKGERR